MIYDALLSVVVPLRDAAPMIENLVAEIEATIVGLFRHYEIVLVDDASDDETVDVVLKLQKRVSNIQLYCLNRRSGIEVAIIAGLDHSIGDYVVTLNPESDPPAMIPVMWKVAQDGIEVVCGVRAAAESRRLRTRLNRLFYRTYAASTGYKIPADISNLRFMSRRVVGYITQNNDRHLLLKVLPFFPTRRVATVEYQPGTSVGGFGRHSIWSQVFSALTILLATSVRPLRLLTLFSTIASIGSLLYAVYVVAVALFKSKVVEGWVSLALPMAIMFFIISLVLGLLSEYIFMLAQQSGNRPVYSIGMESTSSVLEVKRQLNVVAGENRPKEA